MFVAPATPAEIRTTSSTFACGSQYYEYGFWKVPVMLKHGQTVESSELCPDLARPLPCGALLPHSRAAAGVCSA
jgi:hypothetical protein